MPSLLVGKQTFKEATSEQSSIREGAGYDEVFQSGHEPEEGLSQSSEREASAYSPDEEVESCDGEEGEEEKVDEGKDEGDEGGEEGDGDKGEVDGRTPEGGSSGSRRMGTPIHSFSSKCGLSMTLSQQWQPTSLRI